MSHERVPVLAFGLTVLNIALAALGVALAGGAF